MLLRLSLCFGFIVPGLELGNGQTLAAIVIGAMLLVALYVSKDMSNEW